MAYLFILDVIIQILGSRHKKDKVVYAREPMKDEGLVLLKPGPRNV